MMARSLGLPARLVGGYVGGMVNGTVQDSIVLRDSDTHAWPEIYLPGRGWTLYEPTPGFSRPGVSPTTHQPVAATGQQAIAHTSGTQAAPQTQRQVHPATRRALGKKSFGSILPFVVLAVVLLLGALLGLLGRHLMHRRRPPAVQIAYLYRRMCQASRSVGMGPRQGETPREHARRLTAHDPRTAADVWLLATLYEHISYGTQVPSTQDLDGAVVAIRRLRRLWWLRRLHLDRAGASSLSIAARE